MSRFFFAVACVVVCAVHAPAQRCGRYIDGYGDVRVVGGSCDGEWSVDSGGRLGFIRGWPPEPRNGTGEARPSFGDVHTGVRIPGGFFVLADHEVLVSGSDGSGHGVVEHWVWGDDGLSRRSSLRVPDTDMVGVAYAAGTSTLYVLDAAGKRLFKARWSLDASLARVTLVPWLDEKTAPVLAHAADLFLGLHGFAPAPMLHLTAWPFCSCPAGPTVTDLESGALFGWASLGWFPTAHEEPAWVRRDGCPEAFVDGTTIWATPEQAVAKVGERFLVQVPLQRDEATIVADLVYEGLMLVELGCASSEAIVPYGDNALLAGGVYAPATGIVAARTGYGLVFGSIGVPADPCLIGVPVSAQFAMEDGDDYRLSEIYGTVLEGAPAVAKPDDYGADERRTQRRVLLELTAGAVRDVGPRLLHVLSRRA